MRVFTHECAGAAAGIAIWPWLSGILRWDGAVSLCVCLVFCVLGAIFPDWLDKAASRGNYERWQKIHRTWSHNISYWLFLAMCAAAISLELGKSAYNIQASCFAMGAGAFFAGAFSHILLDLLTPMGVGFLPFMSRTRISLKLVKTGSMADLACGFALLAASVLFVYKCELGKYAALLH